MSPLQVRFIFLAAALAATPRPSPVATGRIAGHVRNGGGALKFLNPTARTRHLLDITGLATLVSTYTDEASVVASFA